MAIKSFGPYLLLVCGLMVWNFSTAAPQTTDLEEALIDAAQAALGDKLGLEPAQLDQRLGRIVKADNIDEALLGAAKLGRALWFENRSRVQAGDLDDRPLYWQRLYSTRALRQAEFGYAINIAQREALIETLEMSSRGHSDLGFLAAAEHKKILLTGFDPFLLDRNIEQSNPSGIIALALDGKLIELDGLKAEIQTFMVPVRFEDFDQGEIEFSLREFYSKGLVDMVVTVSMGRDQFALERFPGLRRSATAPGNRKQRTGANAGNPLIPNFPSAVAKGPEFVEFSLPAVAMAKAEGAYQIRINAKVKTLEQGEIEAADLASLLNQTSVAGSGGGYLSNEISYRSINLRAKLNSDIPTGHIHTPKIKTFDEAAIKDILDQTKRMLQLALRHL